VTSDLNPIWLRRVATLLLAASLSVLIGAGSALAAGAPIAVDFDAAMRGVRFDPAKADGNLDATGKANGLLDSDEMALVAQLLSSPDLDLSASGGVRSGDVAAAYAQALASAKADTQRLAKAYPTVGGVSTGYALLGQGSFKAFNAMTTSFGAPLRGDYSLALGLDRFLSADGDADGDGVSNRQEYAAHIKAGRAAFVKAALDPKIRDGAQLAAVSVEPPKTTKKLIGVVLYPGFEVLDVFGPVEMWANVPDFQVVLIAEKAGPVQSAQGVSVMAEYGFDTSPKLDIMMAPGGIGTTAQLENPVYLDFLRQQDRDHGVHHIGLHGISASGQGRPAERPQGDIEQDVLLHGDQPGFQRQLDQARPLGGRRQVRHLIRCFRRHGHGAGAGCENLPARTGPALWPGALNTSGATMPTTTRLQSSSRPGNRRRFHHVQ